MQPLSPGILVPLYLFLKLGILANSCSYQILAICNSNDNPIRSRSIPGITTLDFDNELADCHYMISRFKAIP